MITLTTDEAHNIKRDPSCKSGQDDEQSTKAQRTIPVRHQGAHSIMDVDELGNREDQVNGWH